MEYGCIGEKLGHSFSKIIHNALCDYDYRLVELARDELDAFMKQKDFRAINVTIPYKQDVIPYLDFVDDNARAIGAVNTIVNRDGFLYGYNTDFSGMRALIERNGIEPKGKKVLVLGSGGTSKTALAVAGAMGADSIYRVSRGARDGAITYDEMYLKHTDAQIIIDTTPCGMYPDIGVSAADISRFDRLEGVVDAVYNPLRSEIVSKALSRGITATGGLYMLVAQAVFAAEHFTGRRFETSDIDRVYNQLMNEKESIVLIGMPACGKSTIGKKLSNRLGLPFVDTDALITEREGVTIPEIFARGGESEFRKIESEVIREVAKTGGMIVATGGGAVLDPKNVRLLKQNGRLIFLNRPLEDIPATDDRPLSNDRAKLEALYKTRLPIYRAAADAEVAVTGTVAENTEQVLKRCRQ